VHGIVLNQQYALRHNIVPEHHPRALYSANRPRGSLYCAEQGVTRDSLPDLRLCLTGTDEPTTRGFAET
jgi:hypothetical protein